MIGFLIRRIVSMIPVIFLVTLLTFSLTHVLGGDPLFALLGEEAQLDPEAEALLRERLGLNDPLPVQYVNWLKGVLTGDFGTSIQTRQPVLDAFAQRLPVTMQLGLTAWILAIGVALPLGVVAALNRNRWPDHLASVLALAGVAAPSFWMGLMLILVFAVWWNLLPPSGFVNIWDDPLLAIQYLILPAFTLGVNFIGTITRQMRSSMLEVLGQDYIRTAHAKGLEQRVVLTRHAMRNAMLPVLTVLGLQFATIVGGTIIIEQVFAIPGLGRLALGAVFAQDIPVVQAVVLFAAIATMFGNLWADVMYSVVDPRIGFN